MANENDETKTKLSRPTPRQATRALAWLVEAVKAAPAEERVAHVVALSGMCVGLYGLDHDPSDWRPMLLLGLCVGLEGLIVAVRRSLRDE